MKRYFSLLPVVFFPYSVSLALMCIFNNDLMEALFQNNALFLLFGILVLYVIALACSAIVFIISLVLKWDALELLRVNMIIKLVHIPAYLFIFLFGLGTLITIFTAPISLLLMLLDAMTIVLSGMIGLAGVIRGRSEKKLSTQAAVLLGFLQFIFCVDVMGAILLYRKAKAAQ